MRSLRIFAQQSIDTSPLTAVDLPTPRPGPHEVLIRVECCAVCHTDLHVVEGDLPARVLPVTPGHQVVGRVIDVGSAVADVRVGDRVGAAWLRKTCGQCRFCRRGMENLCVQAEFNGYTADGGYADLMVVPGAFVFRIPESFSSEQAAPLLCAGSIGYRALRLSAIQPGECLGLYGYGASAHLVQQLAQHQGCQVSVFTRSEAHRQLARDLGAVWVGGAEADPPPEIDAGIVFAPAGWIVPLALRALSPGGTLALAGIHMSPIPEMNYGLLYHERVLRSVANLTRQDAHGMLKTAAEIGMKSTVTSYPLARANEALQDLKHGRVNGAAVLRVSAEGDSRIP